MRLLDLFCGAGGCSVGYHRAGFTDIVGVDTDRPALKRYPYSGVRMDAMTALTGGIDLDQFDAIHASPPCQAYSITKHTHGKQHPDLLGPVRDALTAWGERTGRPWVIENVPGAPMPDAITMCGGTHRAWDHYTGRTVRLRRHRLFVSNVALMAEPCACDRTPVGGVYGGAWSKNNHLDPTIKRTGGYTPPDDVQRALMDIDWMTRAQLAQAIPPAYTEHIGWQLINHLEMAA